MDSGDSGGNFNIIENILPGDPVLADILKDCYNTMGQSSQDGRLSFFEAGLKSTLDEILSDSFKVRNRQSEAFYHSFKKLIDKKENNSWITAEKELYNQIEGLLFVKLFGEDEEMTKVIGEYVEAIMRLNFSEKLPTFYIEGIKKNIFNYFGFALESIAESMSESTISKKAIDAYFETQADTIIIVTNESFNIRTINKIGEELFDRTISEIKDDHLFTLIPELGANPSNYLNQSRIIREPMLLRTDKLGLRQVELSFLKTESEEEITEFVFVLNFNFFTQNSELNLHENYKLLNNVICGLHELRKNCQNKDAMANSASLLQNLYQLTEGTKNQLLSIPSQVDDNLNDVIEVNSILKHIQNEIKYTPNIENVVIKLTNKLVRPLICNYESLFSMLKNLIVNAINCQDSGKKINQIEITFSNEAEFTKISVYDNGIGIAARYLDQIFDKGFSINPTPDNLGFGLYFAKRSAKYLGGNISVESEPFNYSRFSILLPL